MHKIQRTLATHGTTSHNRDTGRQRSVWTVDKREVAHTHRRTKNVNIPVVACKCCVEIGWRNLYSIVRRNPVKIIFQYVQYCNAPQHNTNANSCLSALSWHSQRHLTQTIVSVTSTLHTIVSVSVPFRVITRADCSVSPTNVTNTCGQIALWR